MVTSIVQNVNELTTRILDDAFHYMDRLIRLLSKKHPAFKAFCHDFSQTIFIRDKSDVAAVKAILEKNGVSWEYALRAKADAINRRVRRYIPSRHVLVMRLKALFKAYFGFNSPTDGPLFASSEAKQMILRLIKTATLGYLSDPPGISLYYIIGKDRDGLNLYRTVRGTNSVEGGFHMPIRRVFGSLRASPQLAETILINWILRRNIKVGFHNRTGHQYRGHFDIWLRDEIVEFAIAVGTKPSFPMPRVLSSRIATSESMGILPISQELAEKYNITTLPRSQITGVPHHRDTPVHTLTRLSTKPMKPHHYLQLRQLVLHAVVPVHTKKEYIGAFKHYMHDTRFRRSGGTKHPPHEDYKNINFEIFAVFWNELVNFQSHSETDTNLRLYYKVPQQLETHCKKVIEWSTERATLALGSNFTARQPFLALLASTENQAEVLPAIPLPDVFMEDGSELISYDHQSFYRLAPPPVEGEYGDAEFQEYDSFAQNTLDNQDAMEVDPQPLPQSQPVFRQTLLPGAQQPLRIHTGKKDTDRCAVCVAAYCEKRFNCKGNGDRSLCDHGHPPIPSKRVRITEAQVLAELERRRVLVGSSQGSS
jgi:hypothetical protein